MQEATKEMLKEKPNEGKDMLHTFNSILGKSASLQKAIALAHKVAETDVPVLLTGETGTGKNSLHKRYIIQAGGINITLWQSTALHSVKICWKVSSSAIKPVHSQVQQTTRRACLK